MKDKKKGHDHGPKDQFIFDWDKELGWKKNPFLEKILNPPDRFIVGYIQERLKINLFVIKKYDFGIIYGNPGTGKTTISKYLLLIWSQIYNYQCFYLAPTNKAVDSANKRFEEPRIIEGLPLEDVKLDKLDINASTIHRFIYDKRYKKDISENTLFIIDAPNGPRG